MKSQLWIPAVQEGGTARLFRRAEFRSDDARADVRQWTTRTRGLTTRCDEMI